MKEDKMYSFRFVSQNVFKRELVKTQNYDNDVEKRHKEYFNELVDALEIGEEIQKLKKGGTQYKFSEEGAKLLEDVLYKYGKSKRSKDNDNSIKNLERQIFKYKQYNAFVSKKLLDSYDDMMEANNLVIMAIECFYQLFIDVGLSEEDAEQIMSNANRRYSYSKRKGWQKTMSLFRAYIGKLDDINNRRNKEIGLTERENAIWLDYANKELEETIKRVLNVRDIMEEIIVDDVSNSVWDEFKKTQEKDIVLNIETEMQLESKLKEDKKIQKLMKSYKAITSKEINIKKLISLIIVGESVFGNALIDLLMRELLDVQVDGNVKWKQKDVNSIEKILLELYTTSTLIAANYKWTLQFEERKLNRLRDEDLLKEAIEEIK